MNNLLWSGFLILLLLSGCGWDGTPTRHNDFIPLTSIEIVADAPVIAAHSSTKLSVKGSFSGLYTRDITDQVVWSSASPGVAGFATAASPNRVTGYVPGTAILTATVKGLSADFSLTVSSATITALTITPAAPTIASGLNIQFTAIGTFSDLTSQDLTFDAAWSSSPPNIATVGDVAGSKGFAQALAVGTSTISATFGGISGSTLLTVTDPVLTSITVTPANPSILTLYTTSFNATGNYSDNSTKDITGQVSWTSDRSDIATITAGGASTALSQGTALIRASLGGVSGTTSLKVKGGTLTGITISPANLTLVQGTVARMTATGTFSNGASGDITGMVAWSTANSNIANVTVPGGNLAWLNALAVTPALVPTTVTATFGNLTATTNLTVVAPSLQSITISPLSLNLTTGTSAVFTVNATFNDNSTQDVTYSCTWTSSNAAIATVGDGGLEKGRVRGVAAGGVNMSATYGGATVTAPVTVTPRTLQSLTLNQSGNITVLSGNQVTFTATAKYSDNSSQDVTADTSWTIDKPFVAIQSDNVNHPEQIIAVDTGSATLTAVFGGMTQTVTITVP